MRMSKIAHCNIVRCAFNQSSACHASAVTIGDGERPRCDTFEDAVEKGGQPGDSGCVGACKVRSCEYNTRLTCSAKSITVDWKGADPCCMTFEPATEKVDA